MRFKCPKCGHTQVRINRTYATEQGSSKEAICDDCGHRLTFVTVVLAVSPYKAKKLLEEGRVEARLLPES